MEICLYPPKCMWLLCRCCWTICYCGKKCIYMYFTNAKISVRRGSNRHVESTLYNVLVNNVTKLFVKMWALGLHALLLVKAQIKECENILTNASIFEKMVSLVTCRNNTRTTNDIQKLTQNMIVITTFNRDILFVYKYFWSWIIFFSF